ncbi:MerR family transcriptional regulator [Bariatricus massiliensis]|uniref:MerR family transcriptional regulator n=1 Tax=Bariatricus massiliensis TaxID=1745713 RepID=A0ABS8DHB4_9FIRM|nr:MerR family transcriptional regulator [Bariatricus massiliensis]MCB7304079.1 MerR family transcriptional regulator [Bariatricus massiliensis]MCB7387189.1 MerR family transcriptional regulator [Bariatricus massiliensis]MCB7411351.1 MerR family transcriptional regulator [Bariatricus massiliensis]
MGSYTLRYYEKKGVLSVKHDAGGERDYREEDVK